MIAFVDTEYSYDRQICRNRLVSICILKYTYDGVFIHEYDKFVKPDGWVVSSITTEVTGISTMMLEEKGEPIIDIMNNVATLMEDVSMFVAHNVSCDRNVIINEFKDCDIDTLFANITTYDTMTKIAGKMSLSKLHYKLFGETFKNGHDARADTFACARCYFRHKNKEMSYDIDYEEDTEPDFVPSEEQMEIVNICGKYNTIVNAVPGSGKTTTCFAISDAYPDERILLLTYSRSLKDDLVKNKPSHIFNIDAYTFHGMCGKMYGKIIMNDVSMNKCINNDTRRKSSIRYDKILIDEAQDMTELTYRCVSIAIDTYSNETTRVCVLGDENQCLYKYAGADSRYLKLADSIFTNERIWARRPLSTSFRLTRQIATFVNKCILGYDKIVAIRDGVKPIFVYANLLGNDNDACKIVVNKIREYIGMGYTADDIFILSRSVKGNTNGGHNNTPISILANGIQNAMPNINIYSPMGDNKTVLDTKCSNGKLVISSYHQSKGRQRKIVIVYGIDNWMNDNPMICPNTLYVAMTRAQEHLVIVQSDKEPILPFLQDDVSKYCDIVGIKKDDRQKNNNNNDKSLTVTQLCSHLSYINVDACMGYFDYTELHALGNPIEITTYSTQTYTDGSVGIENVSAINGNAIPLIHHFNKTGKCDLIESIRNNFELIQLTPIVGDIVANQILTQYTCNDMYDISKVLRICTAWASIQSNFGYINKQLTECNWLSPDDIRNATANIDELKHSDNVKCEVNVNVKNVEGFIDCFDISKKIVYEYKCTIGALRNEHMIQLAVYMSLCEFRFNGLGIRYILYNILSGQTIEITSTPERLDEMLTYLKRIRSDVNDDIDDDEFVSKCILAQTATIKI
jgi:DNA polymerase III epsilon subunit-like protein